MNPTATRGLGPAESRAQVLLDRVGVR
jgi:hypothetical protein